LFNPETSPASAYLPSLKRLWDHVQNRIDKLVQPQVLFFNHRVQLATLAAYHRLPAIYGWREHDEIRAVVAACHAYSDRLGLFVEVLAVTGARPVQAARLLVGDLQVDRLMMPRSAKGRGQKRVDRRPLPIPPGMVEKLRVAAAGRPADAPLLLRLDGKRWHQAPSDHVVPFAKALAAAGLPKVVPYALRHSSITRALQRGVPARIVADHHDTSVAMLERNYAVSIADHSEAMVRAAQIDLSPPTAGNIVPLALRRE
jgi:integrase